MYKTISNFLAILSLAFIAACGGGGSSEAEDPITPNATPTAVDDSAAVELGRSISIDVIANDSDADGDSITIVSVTQPDSGSVSISNNQIEFVTGTTAGEVTFDYFITDGNSNSQPATVTVMVDSTTLTLDGRVVSPFDIQNIKVSANIESTSGVRLVETTTGDNNLYSLTLEFSELTDSIQLSASDEATGLLFYSDVSTAQVLTQKADQEIVISYTRYLPLELSSFSTALAIFVDEKIESSNLIDNQTLAAAIEKSSGDEVFHLAILISQVLEGTTDLPEEVSSLEELYQDISIVKDFVSSVAPHDFEELGDELLQQITHYPLEDILSNSTKYFYNYRDTQADYSMTPMLFEGNESITFKSSLNVSSGYFALVENHDVEQEFLLETNNGFLELTSLSEDPMDDLIYIRTQSVEECNNEATTVTMTFRKISLYPVYIGENFDQYLIRYSGDLVPGLSLSQPCNGADDLDWSRVKLVNVSKNNTPLSESLEVSTIATRVGTELDFGPQSYSLSLIDLHNDGSATVKLDDTQASWEFTDSGDLLINLASGDKIEYHAIGNFGSATRYVALKTFMDGRRELFPGLIMNRDSNLQFQDLAGRYESQLYIGGDSDFAFSFQEDFLGQQSYKNFEGIWVAHNTTPASPTSAFKWSPLTDELHFEANYYIRANEDGSYSNASILGCDDSDETCFHWRNRQFDVLAVDDEYYYMMLNNSSDYNFQGYDEIHQWGYLGVFKKMDFILPVVE